MFCFFFSSFFPPSVPLAFQLVFGKAMKDKDENWIVDFEFMDILC